MVFWRNMMHVPCSFGLSQVGGTGGEVNTLEQIGEQNAYTGGFSGLSFLTEKGQKRGGCLDI